MLDVEPSEDAWPDVMVLAKTELLLNDIAVEDVEGDWLGEGMKDDN